MGPFSTPKLGSDLPLYPHLMQLVRVTSATVPGPAGVAQVAGSSVLAPVLYVAFTQQVMEDSLLPRDREPCLVTHVDQISFARLVSPLAPGFYTGRLVGSHNSLPVYEIGGVGTLVALRAISGTDIDLGTGTSGSAYIDWGARSEYPPDDTGGIQSYNYGGFGTPSAAGGDIWVGIPQTGFYNISACVRIRNQDAISSGRAFQVTVQIERHPYGTEDPDPVIAKEEHVATDLSTSRIHDVTLCPNTQHFLLQGDRIRVLAAYASLAGSVLGYIVDSSPPYAPVLCMHKFG